MGSPIHIEIIQSGVMGYSKIKRIPIERDKNEFWNRRERSKVQRKSSQKEEIKLERT